MLRGINPGFPGLFPTRRKVVYVFRTRLPVAINCIATVMLPHDLHVLSLPLAFILSQDQTLHCKCCLMLTLLIQRINVSNRIVFALTYLLSRLNRDVLLLPNFQRSFGFPSLSLGMTSLPFFGSANVRAILFLAKTFLQVFS